MFSLVCALPSPASAEACASLFDWFTGTTAQSDFSGTCMSAVWFMAFADRSCSFEQDVREISRFSCMLFLSVRGFSDYAGPNSHSRNSVAAVLPSSISEGSRHPDPSAFRSSIARPTGTSGLRFTRHLTVPPARLEARMESLFSFPVGLFHPLQHAGLSRRTPVCRHPCKSFVKGEKDSPDARLGGARTIEAIRTRNSHVCLSAVVSCLRRTGHPFTVSGPCGPSQKIECVFSASPETIRREPREFDVRRSVGNRRTWQSARCVILLFFVRRAAVSKPLRSGNLGRVRSRVAPDPRRADTPPFSELRLASLDWHSPSVSLFHRPRPDYDPVWVPASRPPPAHAGYVCCAVWKAGCASPCRRSSFHHRRVRSN